MPLEEVWEQAKSLPRYMQPTKSARARQLETKNRLRTMQKTHKTGKASKAPVIKHKKAAAAKPKTPSTETEDEFIQDENRLKQSPVVNLSPAESRVVEQIISENTGDPIKDVNYFKHLVQTNADRLESLAAQWDQLNEDTELCDDVHGEIRSVSCQARLIIAERFKQFSGLIKKCENNVGEKPVLVGDLDGFWDMIFFQVEDVLAKFDKLTKLQEAGWKKENSPVVVKKIKAVKKKVVKPQVTSKFAAFRANLKQIQSMDNSQLKKEEAIAQALQIPERTYSLRRSTIEKTFESRLSVTPARSQTKFKNIASRSAKSSRRKSTKILNGLENLQIAASPDLASYLRPSQKMNLSRIGCSPSPITVRAMMSASKSGRMKDGKSSLVSGDKLFVEENLDSSISEHLKTRGNSDIQGE
ncbi:DLGAP5 [Bugula neritina]|uniref:DLGAP5 n=1 Tax=Bugula neritina TaxID=10212 RepID=A0A7J7KID4_BUGNE|nr:DLGAP5 [Bugula neritina]